MKNKTLVSSRRVGLRDIKTLLTAPISRIKTLWDDEGRMAKGNVGQVVPDNQIKRHSRMSLSGIPTSFNNAQGGDPGQKPSGMTVYLNNTPLPCCAVFSPQGGQRTARGFTLIELLVVVLIIGILAAIALPQYQKSIVKTRLTEYELNLSTLAKAAEICRLSKGEACTLADFDISMGPCMPLPGFLPSCTYSVHYYSSKDMPLAIVVAPDGNRVFSYYYWPGVLSHLVDGEMNTQHMKGLYCNTGFFTESQCKQLGFTEFVIYNSYRRPRP